MKILVCLSVVPDTTSKITFKNDNSEFNREGVQFIINPYDELALTKAMELAEMNNGTVSIVNVGLADAEPSIRKALAIGANDAYRINTEPKDAMYVAAQIAALARENSYDLILTGRESIDYNGGMMCGLLGEMLNMPSINVVTSIDIENGTVKATRDIDGGKEDVECTLPCVASAQKDLCEPRIPNMRGIMAARTKPLNVREAVNGFDFASYGSYELPPAKAGVKMIPAENAEELFDLLRNEKKVI
ncbi:MAG: electron transfer flavoprotein subunit beta/FixA family protein [Flavobacteriales bacterium]|nr:electron transfer flavoprotein subunit beta/FixA family protein [Flavobacteriales bacterium]